jgi:hypothetical protein
MLTLRAGRVVREAIPEILAILVWETTADKAIPVAVVATVREPGLRDKPVPEDLLANRGVPELFFTLALMGKFLPSSPATSQLSPRIYNSLRMNPKDSLALLRPFPARFVLIKIDRSQ